MRRLAGILKFLPHTWDSTLRRCLLLWVLVVVVGTGGYSWIEGWPLWQSLFFTLVTLTTVGYGDYGLTVAGERFTAIIMIVGIGTVSYAASQIFQVAAARALNPEKRMLHQAARMQGHHIVCGLGRIGGRVARRLFAEGVPVVAIDDQRERVDAMRALGVTTLCGDAACDELLAAAGIERASAMAAVTSSDAINALICLSARAASEKITLIARAEDEGSISKLYRAGATTVISPSRYGSSGIAECMVRPSVAELLFGNCDHGQSLLFAELEVGDQSPHVGRTIADIGLEHPRIVFVAAKGGAGELKLRPDSQRALERGDVLVIAGTAEDVGEVRMARMAAA